MRANRSLTERRKKPEREGRRKRKKNPTDLGLKGGRVAFEHLAGPVRHEAGGLREHREGALGEKTGGRTERC